jgi:hypothetical protein
MLVVIWHRVGVAIFGLLVVLVGLVVWGFTQEYGSGLNFAMKGVGDSVTVYEVDEQRGVQTPVFQGSGVDALAFTERRRAEETSFLVPSLIIGAGAVLVIAAFIPIRQIGKNSPSVAQ